DRPVVRGFAFERGARPTSGPLHHGHLRPQPRQLPGLGLDDPRQLHQPRRQIIRRPGFPAQRDLATALLRNDHLITLSERLQLHGSSLSPDLRRRTRTTLARSTIATRTPCRRLPSRGVPPFHTCTAVAATSPAVRD